MYVKHTHGRQIKIINRPAAGCCGAGGKEQREIVIVRIWTNLIR
jgi:hypothetical protein